MARPISLLLVPALLALTQCRGARGPSTAVASAALGRAGTTLRASALYEGGRANELAAPCALECRPGRAGQGILCACHEADSIYFEHVSDQARAQAQKGASLRLREQMGREQG